MAKFLCYQKRFRCFKTPDLQELFYYIFLLKAINYLIFFGVFDFSGYKIEKFASNRTKKFFADEENTKEIKVHVQTRL